METGSKKIEAQPTPAEIKDFAINERILTRYDEGMLILDHISDPAGKSIREIAEESTDNRVVSLRVVKVGEGTCYVDGKKVTVRTPPLERIGGQIFVDAEVFTLDQVKASQPSDKFTAKERGNLIWNMEINKLNRMARTRLGKWQNFKEGDSVVQTKNPQK